ncbi:MAG: RNA polymerase subunit sigma-70, partial [Actinobacteria bacterium]
MHYEQADDDTLVAAARGGDIAAFEALVRRHSRAVFAHAARF